MAQQDLQQMKTITDLSASELAQQIKLPDTRKI
jgi:hypothetical protein